MEGLGLIAECGKSVWCYARAMYSTTVLAILKLREGYSPSGGCAEELPLFNLMPIGAVAVAVASAFRVASDNFPGRLTVVLLQVVPEATGLLLSMVLEPSKPERWND